MTCLDVYSLQSYRLRSTLSALKPCSPTSISARSQIGPFHVGRNVLPNALLEDSVPRTPLSHERPASGDNVQVHALDNARLSGAHGAPQPRG